MAKKRSGRRANEILYDTLWQRLAGTLSLRPFNLCIKDARKAAHKAMKIVWKVRKPLKSW